MCTSVAIGFYIRNENQFQDFKTKILKMSKEENSIFSVYEKKPEPVEIDEGVIEKVQIDEDMEDDFCIV